MATTIIVRALVCGRMGHGQQLHQAAWSVHRLRGHYAATRAADGPDGMEARGRPFSVGGKGLTDSLTRFSFGDTYTYRKSIAEVREEHTRANSEHRRAAHEPLSLTPLIPVLRLAASRSLLYLQLSLKLLL